MKTKILAYFQICISVPLNTLNFSNNDIENIIQNLDTNKAPGHDKIGIRKIKICGKSICKPLKVIFSQCIDTGSFLLEWKKSQCSLSSKER